MIPYFWNNVRYFIVNDELVKVMFIGGVKHG